MIRLIAVAGFCATVFGASLSHAESVEQWDEPVRAPFTLSYDGLRGALKNVVHRDAERSSRWKADVQYSDRLESSEALRTEKRGVRKRKLRYAAVQREFGEGQFRPVLGFGASDTLDMQALVGGAMQFSEKITASISYGMPIKRNDASLPDQQDGAETMSFSFKVQLH